MVIFNRMAEKVFSLGDTAAEAGSGSFLPHCLCIWSHICLVDVGRDILACFPSSVQIWVFLSPIDIQGLILSS